MSKRSKSNLRELDEYLDGIGYGKVTPKQRKNLMALERDEHPSPQELYEAKSIQTGEEAHCALDSIQGIESLRYRGKNGKKGVKLFLVDCVAAAAQHRDIHMLDRLVRTVYRHWPEWTWREKEKLFYEYERAWCAFVKENYVRGVHDARKAVERELLRELASSTKAYEEVLNEVHARNEWLERKVKRLKKQMKK